MKKLLFSFFVSFLAFSSYAQSDAVADDNFLSAEFIYLLGGVVTAVIFFFIVKHFFKKKVNSKALDCYLFLPATQILMCYFFDKQWNGEGGNTLLYYLSYGEDVMNLFLVFYSLIFYPLIIIFASLMLVQLYHNGYFEERFKRYGKYLTYLFTAYTVFEVFPWLKAINDLASDGIILILMMLACCGLMWWCYKNFNEMSLSGVQAKTAPKSENMKACPFCGEEILNIAVKCKHCGEWLKDSPNLAFAGGQVDTSNKVEAPINPEKIECPICGETIDSNVEVCPFCNEKVK